MDKVEQSVSDGPPVDPAGAVDRRGAAVERYQSFDDFWPHYLREHSKRSTRLYHYIGTSLVVGLAAAAVAKRKPLLVAALPVAGYGFAWAGHALAERNRPATFTYPSWSLKADFKMWALGMTGQLKPHLESAGVSSTPRIA
jgi:hypothetical protein